MSINLKEKVLSGGFWNSVSKILSSGLQIIQLSILSRYLRPDDFGSMAIVMIVIGLGLNYSEAGLGNAIIQDKDIDHTQLTSLYWFNHLLGIIICLISIALTPLIIKIFNMTSNGYSLIFYSSFLFLVMPFGQIKMALLRKELKFKKISFIEIVASVTDFCISVICAVNNLGVYSLLWGKLSYYAVLSLMTSLIAETDWKPGFFFNINGIKHHIRFGLYQFAINTLYFFGSQIDKMILGAFIGMESLGFYELAHKIVIQPVIKITPILQTVALPAFAQIKDSKEKLKQGFYLLVKILAFANFILLAVIIVTASPVVILFFGKEWLPSVLLIQLLSVMAMLRSVASSRSPLTIASGKVKRALFRQVIYFIISSSFLFFASQTKSTVNIAVALIFVETVFIVLDYFILVKPILGSCLKEYTGALLPAAGVASLIALSGFFAASFIADYSPLYQLIISGFVILIILVLSLGTFAKSSFLEFKKLFADRNKS